MTALKTKEYQRSYGFRPLTFCLVLVTLQEGFEEKYKDRIEAIEKRVEEDYIGRLQSQCYRERQYSKYLMSTLFVTSSQI